MYGKDQPKDKVNSVKFPKKSRADNSRRTTKKIEDIDNKIKSIEEGKKVMG